MDNDRCYLGDGVYASFDGYTITLWTDYGDGPMNTIYLEPTVMECLCIFASKVGSEAPL